MDLILNGKQNLWKPVNAIDGLLPFLWLDASRITGLNDGDAITTWADISGNGRDATQATASFKPVFKAGILAGKPVVRFDGTDDGLATANVTLSQPRTFFAVAIRRTFATTYDRMIWSSGSHGEITFNNVENQAINYAGTILTASANDNTWHIFGGIQNGASSSISVDGVVTSGDIGAGNIAAQPIIIGGSGGGAPAYPLHGDIAEVIIYPGALTAPGVKRVIAYLGRKYGLGIT